MLVCVPGCSVVRPSDRTISPGGTLYELERDSSSDDDGDDAADEGIDDGLGDDDAALNVDGLASPFIALADAAAVVPSDIYASARPGASARASRGTSGGVRASGDDMTPMDDLESPLVRLSAAPSASASAAGGGGVHRGNASPAVMSLSEFTHMGLPDDSVQRRLTPSSQGQGVRKTLTDKLPNMLRHGVTSIFQRGDSK